MSDVAAMDKGFQYPIDAGLRNVEVLKDILECKRPFLDLEKLKNVERF
jgi:hypothetical protein